ncbi:YfcC family protein [Caniella muris]|uniref:YfcC family protein n=1 Tax=Caniella muris TaxID=2941502 RepID=UPI00203B3286|nr:AbgT family transporter [Caniella muris]
MSDMTKPKKKREMLSSYTILFIILIVVALISIAMSMAIPDITGATLGDVLMAPAEGFVDAVDVCLFVMVLGGFLAIVERSGALNAGISTLVRAMGGNELKLIPILMVIFSIMGTTYGFCEESVGFYALLAATMMAAGTDVLVGAAMVLLGAGCGVLGSTVNPFATGVASATLTSIGIPVDQTIIIVLGLILMVVADVISIVFVYNYAKKVKADTGRSILTGHEIEAAEKEYGSAAKAVAEAKAITGRQKAVLVLFAVTFVVMIIGFIPWEDLNVDAFNAGYASEEVTAPITGEEIVAAWGDGGIDGDLVFNTEPDATVTTETTTSLGWSAFLTGTPLGQWYFAEATAWFLIMAIVIGIVAGLSERELVDTFIAGAGDMMGVVLVIALARGVSVLMDVTGLSNWILASAAAGLKGMSAIVFAPLSFILYVLLSFLIPSSSGMATVSMPIMGPLAVELGFSPEVMVQIYSSANGFVNLFTPTCGAIMGGLALARVEYSTWLKFATKLLVILFVVLVVIVTVACMVVPA